MIIHVKNIEHAKEVSKSIAPNETRIIVITQLNDATDNAVWYCIGGKNWYDEDGIKVS
jgi:hypothetical protein